MVDRFSIKPAIVGRFGFSSVLEEFGMEREISF